MFTINHLCQISTPTIFGTHISFINLHAKIRPPRILTITHYFIHIKRLHDQLLVKKQPLLILEHSSSYQFACQITTPYPLNQNEIYTQSIACQILTPPYFGNPFRRVCKHRMISLQDEYSIQV